MCYCIFPRRVCTQRRVTANEDDNCRMNFNTMELEVFVAKVNTHSGKQRNKENNR